MPQARWDWAARSEVIAGGMGRDNMFPRLTRRLLMLLAASALLLGIPAAATAFASSATSGSGWIRLAHLSPNTPAVDVYLYSFDDSNAKIVLHHVAYGDASPYETVTAGD